MANKNWHKNPTTGEVYRGCPDCGNSVGESRGRYCDPCSRARSLYRSYASGQTLALAEVGRAVHKGLLPKPATLTCVDCGQPAKFYDHRDYSKPLDVVPVCIRCNRMRGMAKRKDWSFAEMLQYLSTLSVSAWRGYYHLTRKDFEAMRKKYWPNEDWPTEQEKEEKK